MSRGDILEKLRKVPSKPGVYIFKDSDGRVLYVGKAKSLRRRMTSYFQSKSNSLPKIDILVERVEDFEFYVVDNEVEALVLECKMIKKHRPPFNVSYRDDKSYPCIAVTVADDFPRVMITRERRRRGTKYYGPYTNAAAVRETFDALRRIFPFRTCKRKVPGRSTGSPCLNFHIKRCLGPCVGAVGRAEYREMIDEVCRFLEGRSNEIIENLKKEMEEAASVLEFERAAKARDRIEAALCVLQRQKIVSSSSEDFDAIGIAVGEGVACANVSIVRGGKMIGSESFLLNLGSEESDVLGAFVKQYYSSTDAIPKVVLLPGKIAEAELVERWLSQRRRGKVALRVPARGEKKGLIELANSNARHFLDMNEIGWCADESAARRAASEVASALGLPRPPRRIECFDVSTIQGSSSVGSMVVFVDGKPKKEDYRRFKIASEVNRPNDFAMMKEITSRRFAALAEGIESSFSEKPDLVVVDGGKPQLAAALSALAAIGLCDIPVAAIAKREDEIHVADRSEPIRLPEGSEGIKLIKRMRDEAHRFAVSYHRKLRSKSMVESELDGIPGLGERRKQLLISRFGSPAVLREATLEELQSVPGLPKVVAERVYRFYRGGKNGSFV